MVNCLNCLTRLVILYFMRRNSACCTWIVQITHGSENLHWAILKWNDNVRIKNLCLVAFSKNGLCSCLTNYDKRIVWHAIPKSLSWKLFSLWKIKNFRQICNNIYQEQFALKSSRKCKEVWIIGGNLRKKLIGWGIVEKEEKIKVR